MSLANLTSRDAVLEAIAEYRRIGRYRFLPKYGFREARHYFLLHEGELYDSKAIVGAAHGFQHPSLGPLGKSDFSGGDATVKKKLEELGFTVRVLEDFKPSAAASSLRQKIQRLKVWQKGNERAVHKPLLLLLALGRVQRGAKRLIAFRELEEPLRGLLGTYGPPRFTNHHPEYPFWWLQKDGLWEVPGGDALTPRVGSSSPTLMELRKVSGGFPRDVYALLRRRDDLVRELGRILLDAHFPKQVHAALLSAVGLDVEVDHGTDLLPTSDAAELTARVARLVRAGRIARPPGQAAPKKKETSSTSFERDPRVVAFVLTAAGGRCEACTALAPFERADGTPFLEVHHVKLLAEGGSDTVENAIAVCPNCHRRLHYASDRVAYRSQVLAKVARLRPE